MVISVNLAIVWIISASEEIRVSRLKIKNIHSFIAIYKKNAKKHSFHYI